MVHSLLEIQRLLPSPSPEQLLGTYIIKPNGIFGLGDTPTINPFFSHPFHEKIMPSPEQKALEF